ncbi:MAG: hypothetical protein K2O01_08095, partial [Bacteroidales bacterium]|nr:hypothetical protein [Bacteroidales bacterium]
MAQTAEEKQSATYSNSLNKSAKVAPDINITYPKLTSGYACAGDTILVKAVADDITGLVLPESKYFSGDADGAVVEQTPTSITKRFYTYHPYRTANPTSAATENMSFVIRTKSGSHTIAKDIIAQSCPPTINTPKLQSSTVNGKYNLGYIAFEFSFPNQTTHKDSTLFVPDIAPDQPFVLYLAQRSASNKLEIRYRSIPTSDARYEIRVTYNEGDSIRLASFGPYDFPVAPLNAITPNQSAYCSGEDIAFTLTLADEYDKMLRQTVDPGKPAEIAACFDWSGSPSEVTFTGSKDNQYFFSTKATGASNEYNSMMSADLRYQSTFNRPTIDTTIHVTYDIPIGTFSYHSS